MPVTPNLLTLKRISRTLKEWPEPEKTFGDRKETRFIKAGDHLSDSVAKREAVKDSKISALTIKGKEIDLGVTGSPKFWGDILGGLE